MTKTEHIGAITERRFWIAVLALAMAWIIVVALITSSALAGTSSLQVTATVLPQPVTIQTDGAQGVTISSEDMIAYCYARGEEVYECDIKPEEVVRWRGSVR